VWKSKAMYTQVHQGNGVTSIDRNGPYPAIQRLSPGQA
jgi:hypothetical protein